jgi:hypothetical protein
MYVNNINAINYKTAVSIGELFLFVGNYDPSRWCKEL